MYITVTNGKNMNTNSKQLLAARIILALLAITMAAFTLPAYLDPTSNPGLNALSGESISLGSTAGAFLGRQLTLIIIALIGAISGQRLLVAIGGFGIGFMNGHDAIFMGLVGGESMAFAAGAGAVFALLATLTAIIAIRSSGQSR